MTITIIGASGFIGRALTRYLLETTTARLHLYCRSAMALEVPPEYAHRVARFPGDITTGSGLPAALDGADVAFYLVHLMNGKDEFSSAEAKAADIFVRAALQARLPRTVFLGGLGSDADNLSPHLRSRHLTGQLLRARLPLVIELRASMVIGRGSVAYDIIRAMAYRLPLLVVPRWSDTLTQPIALADVLRYLAASSTLDAPSSIIEIGGPEAVKYPQLIARYARFIGRHDIVFAVPGVPKRAARWWLWHFLRRKDAAIGQAMIDSLHNPMVVTDDTARRLFPQIKPRSIAEAFD